MTPTFPAALHRACAAALLTLSACGGAADSAPAADGAAVSTAAHTSPDPFAALAADSAAIMDDLKTLSSDAMEGRGTGTAGAARARAYLEAGLRTAGVVPLDGGFERTFTWMRPRETVSRTGVNLLGTVAGTSLADRVIVVSAHYDHLGVRNGEIYNGADDDASGAVGLLALARALRGHPLRHALLYAEFDAEEAGLRGAKAFVAEPPVPLATIDVDLNLDMVSRTAGLLWASGSYQTPSLRPLLERVAARSPVELRLGHDHEGAPEGDDWTDQGDHGAFNDAGIPFVYLGVEDHPDYHRPTDDFENIDAGEYMNALRATLMVLLALDAAFPLPSAGS